MQTRDEVKGLHNSLEFSQPLSGLHQAMQTRIRLRVMHARVTKSQIKGVNLIDNDELGSRCLKGQLRGGGGGGGQMQ